MTTLTPSFDAALTAPAVTLFCAIEIKMPNHDLRLVDGAGAVSFGGMTFTGADDVYGVLNAVEAVGDGVDAEAPALAITLLPPTMTATATLASPAAQGSPVSVWIGALDPISGQVIPDPELVFLGEVDVPTLSGDRNARALQLDVVSVFERFVEAEEGVRLSDAFHRTVWPDDPSMEFITGVQDAQPWGAEAHLPASVRAVTSPSEGGADGPLRGRQPF